MMMTNWKPYIFCGVLIAVSLTAMPTLDLDIDETIFCKSVLGGSVFTIFAMRWLCKRLGLTQDRDLGEPKSTSEDGQEDAIPENRKSDSQETQRVTAEQTDEARKRLNSMYP